MSYVIQLSIAKFIDVHAHVFAFMQNPGDDLMPTYT